MRRIRFDAALFAVAVLALPLVSCVDGPSLTQPLDSASAPDVLLPSPAVRGFGNSLGLRTDPIVVLGRTSPLPNDVTTSQVMGPEGGILHLPAGGMRLYVPSGALDRPTQISATALAGSLVAYEFHPHGLQFARDVRVFQDLSVTVLAEATSASVEGDGGLYGGYYEGPVGPVTPTLETFPARIMKVYDGGGGESLLAVFETNHFSGYIIGTN